MGLGLFASTGALGSLLRVLLRWRMVGRGDYLFGPGQLSDGSLRIMALVSLSLSLSLSSCCPRSKSQCLYSSSGE